LPIAGVPATPDGGTEYHDGMFYFRIISARKVEPMARKYSRGASKKVKRAMRKRKKGTLKSGSGKKVKSRKQAIAIGLSEARSEGKKVPKKRKSKKRK
jgi:hypothetical protein